MVEIDKIYLINLDDKIHRWDKFYDIDSRIERFSAVDSRDDFRVCESLKLELSPVGLSDKLYFSYAPGAVGAYCSHYLIWADILRNNYKNALILEDDAFVDDVIKFLNSDFEVPNNIDFIQLNTRWYNAESFYLNFDGFESYILTNRCAKIFVETTHDASHFQNKITSGPFGFYNTSKLKDSDLFKKDYKKQDWTKKNKIRCAVDKLAGYCANPKIQKNKRIRVEFAQKIQIYDQKEKSDIHLNELPWHEQSEHEIIQFTKSQTFEYWKSKLYLSPSHVPRKKIKISFLTSSMNRCNHLKQTLTKNIDTLNQIDGLNYEYILLNFNSTDDTHNWSLQQSFYNNSNFKYIHTNKYKFFNMSISKNILGKTAEGEVLCWVDADNILSEQYITDLIEVYSSKKNIFTFVDYHENKKGLTGRISCKLIDFYEVGGYDESFDGWGYEDVDFRLRLKLVGLTEVECGGVEQIDTIDTEKFANYEKIPKKLDTNSSFKNFEYSSNLQNFAKSQVNIINRNYRVNSNSEWGIC
jgi:GR25 family glycosyltransferase involved in LPS biosynthesis